MSYFAKVLDGKVIQVILAEKEFFNNYVDSTPGQWVETSYNTRGGKHYDDNGKEDNETPLRANYAGIGYTYDQTNDVFYAPQPYPSWTISAPDWIWKSPVDIPTDGKEYKWDESIKNWVLITA